MSFSQNVKTSLAKMTIGKEEYISEIGAMVRMNGTIGFSLHGEVTVEFLTENNPLARRIFSLIKALYAYDALIMVKRNPRLGYHNNYLVTIKDVNTAQKFLQDVGLRVSAETFAVEDRFPQKLTNSELRRRAYLRGAFLGAGTVIDPNKGYHLELVCRDALHSKRLKRLLEKENLESKISLRGEDRVVYLKEAEKISDFLAMLGAHKEVLYFENVRVLKDMRAHVNRLVNCENANMDKALNTGLKQVEWIKWIEEKKGLESLPSDMRALCALRLKNKEISLKELGEKANPPLSKSAIRHRFSKIEKLAKELGYKD